MAFDGIKSLFKGAADGLQRLRFNAWTMRGHGAEIFEKSAEALQLERINPLRGVDEWRLGQIFDDARDGIYADLAWLYNEIEGVEPALVACCDMRESAASECGWLVRTADAAKTRGFDEKLADDQRDALLEEFGAVDDDLAALAAHLVSAFFRGAAHALPLWNEDGSLAGFRNIDLWNFAFDRGAGIWYWNADASRDEGTFQPIPPGELVTLAVSSSRHVDHAALPIFIRAALGAKRYGVWLDRFGIPPVCVIMPPNAERGEQQNYMDLARKFARGGHGILPNGSQVTYGTEARAVCPFQDFIRFQQQQIFTVGIGRVQSGDNQGENLGGNAAGVVEGGFRRLVRRDARRIARAINDAVTAKVLARRFPGKPALAQFAWDTEAKRTSREVLEDAGLAKNAGLAIDIDQVQELTGYKLTKCESGGVGSEGVFVAHNAKSPTHPLPHSPTPSKTPLQTSAKPLQIAPSKPDGRGEGSPEDALVEALSGLFEKTMTEAAAEGLEKEDEVVVNEIANPCPKCHRNMPKNNVCSFCAKRATNHTAGKSALSKVAETHEDVVGAMERDSIGKIDFIWGDSSEGVCHIMEKHPEDAAMIPGVIAYGDVYEDVANGKYYCVKKRNLVVLRKGRGTNHYLITGYQKDDPKAIAKIRKENHLVEKGE